MQGVFTAVHRLSLIEASGGYALLWCMGFSLLWHLLLKSTDSRHVGVSSCSTWPAVVALGLKIVAHELSLTAYRIFLDQASNSSLFYWQADSLPLSHQGSLYLLLVRSKNTPPHPASPSVYLVLPTGLWAEVMMCITSGWKHWGTCLWRCDHGRGPRQEGGAERLEQPGLQKEDSSFRVTWTERWCRGTRK